MTIVPCIPPPPSQAVSKAKFTHRLTHIHAAVLQHTHTHTYISRQGFKHNIALSLTHTALVYDGKKKNNNNQCLVKATCTAHCSDAHTHTNKNTTKKRQGQCVCETKKKNVTGQAQVKCTRRGSAERWGHTRYEFNSTMGVTLRTILQRVRTTCVWGGLEHFTLWGNYLTAGCVCVSLVNITGKKDATKSLVSDTAAAVHTHHLTPPFIRNYWCD